MCHLNCARVAFMELLLIRLSSDSFGETVSRVSTKTVCELHFREFTYMQVIRSLQMLLIRELAYDYEGHEREAAHSRMCWEKARGSTRAFSVTTF